MNSAYQVIEASFDVDTAVRSERPYDHLVWTRLSDAQREAYHLNCVSIPMYNYVVWNAHRAGLTSLKQAEKTAFKGDADDEQALRDWHGRYGMKIYFVRELILVD